VCLKSPPVWSPFLPSSHELRPCCYCCYCCCYCCRCCCCGYALPPASRRAGRREGECDVRLLQFDLEHLASVRQAAEELVAAEPSIHLLILNAGVMASPLL
jgi:hypothetical protein